MPPSARRRCGDRYATGASWSLCAIQARNTNSVQAVSLQTVQRWCLQPIWCDCLAARYRIDSGPVFGTLFAALSDDSEEVRADGLPGIKRYGSVLFRPDSPWPKEIREGLFKA